MAFVQFLLSSVPSHCENFLAFAGPSLNLAWFSWRTGDFHGDCMSPSQWPWAAMQWSQITANQKAMTSWYLSLQNNPGSVHDGYSDVMWHHWTWSTLVQVMAYCLMAPCRYVNLCWLIISVVLWHSPKGNFTGSSQDIYLCYEFENDQFNITVASPIGLWVNIF